MFRMRSTGYQLFLGHHCVVIGFPSGFRKKYVSGSA
jgi:hypothetical protein